MKKLETENSESLKNSELSFEQENKVLKQTNENLNQALNQYITMNNLKEEGQYRYLLLQNLQQIEEQLKETNQTVTRELSLLNKRLKDFTLVYAEANKIEVE